MGILARILCGGLLTVSISLALAESADREWRYYAKDAGGTRFSPLDDIHRGNVADLERAWTYRTGDIAEGGAHYAECTPLVVDGVMYVITPFSRLIAIDATHGTELWRFTPEPPLALTETGGGGLASRGIAYLKSKGKRRVILPVRDGRVYCIDVGTHKPDPDFGSGGYIDLRAGLPDGGRYLMLSSPPAIYKNVLLQPYGINDTSAYHVPYVPVRAYDTRTGELLWSFDTVPQPGQFGHDTWGGNSWNNRGGCNPWAPVSVDEKRGIFYIAVGAPNADKYGGDRHGDNLFANSVVALDAMTGERIWHYQTVHHDVWDYDLPALPVLFDARIGKKTFSGVAVVGKTGFVYVFDRVTGSPLHPIEERPVPASDVPGEYVSPTQPFPSKPPAFSRQQLRFEDLSEIDPVGKPALETAFHSVRSEGLFTPPSLRGSIVLPGQLGGGNWSGAAVAPDGMMYVTANDLPYVSMVTPSESPYGATAKAGHFRDALGYPAIKPPWGTLTKIDLLQGEIVWQKPLGEFVELTAKGVAPTGQLNFGGATVTAGGVVFAAASMDGRFRAFDAETGHVLYEDAMEAAGYGAPVTYSGSDNVQYVAIFAGGGGKAHTVSGDYVIAYRLKRGAEKE
ncbi:MAG: alcohol dehydrogenase [Candidatus Hydrogenedentota bacterium]